MRYSFRTLVTPVALAILAGTWAPATGQPVKPTRPGSTPTNGTPRTQTGNSQQSSPESKPARPAGNPPVNGNQGDNPQRTNQNQVVPAAARGPERVAQVEPEVLLPALETILRDWEKKSSQIKSLHGSHTRTVYNLVFEEERIAKGKFFLQTPDKGRIDLVGEKPKADAKARLGPMQKPFKIVPDRSEKWICTGDEIVMVDDEQKTFQVLPLPEEAKGTNIINTPLPFLFGMKADDAKRRFRFELNKDTKESAVLIIFPKLEADLQNYAKAFVILDKSTYLPTAVKLFDPTAKMETVYKFEAVKINDTGIRAKISEALGWRDKDIFRPDLKGQGYKLVLPPAPETPPQKNSSQLPAGQAQGQVPAQRAIKKQ
ncbi:MAG: hypothetical protein WCJ09_01015 [Planctomycetota bacterium]